LLITKTRLILQKKDLEAGTGNFERVVKKCRSNFALIARKLPETTPKSDKKTNLWVKIYKLDVEVLSHNYLKGRTIYQQEPGQQKVERTSPALAK